MSDHSSSPSRAASVVDLSPGIQTARPYRFTWDPSTRMPGPGSVSEATEGKGDYIESRLRPDALNANLTTLAPGALPAEWSSTKHGFHGKGYSFYYGTTTLLTKNQRYLLFSTTLTNGKLHQRHIHLCLSFHQLSFLGFVGKTLT